ncbi:protein of unknown function [Pararobbsia alpina]
MKTSVFVEDGSKHWATVLTELLCANPALAQGNWQAIAELLARTMVWRNSMHRVCRNDCPRTKRAG